jgi:hypothetical protein
MTTRKANAGCGKSCELTMELPGAELVVTDRRIGRRSRFRWACQHSEPW